LHLLTSRPSPSPSRKHLLHSLVLGLALSGNRRQEGGAMSNEL
jgi:hypothetical protein